MSDDAENSARAEQIAAFLAMSTPRRVPAELRRAARRLAVPMLVAVVGGIFLAAGICATAKFFPWNLYEDFQLRAPDTASATGRVTAVADTWLSIDKKRVVSYVFEFQATGGQRACGMCFTSGRRWTENAEVPVRYRPADPALCCIVGARRSVGDGASAMVLFFPLVGGGLIAWFIRARNRMNALLEQGALAEARVSAVEQTGYRVNRRFVHRIQLQPSDSGKGQLRVETTLPDIIAFARGRMDTQRPVFVLYDPARPKRALLPEAL